MKEVNEIVKPCTYLRLKHSDVPIEKPIIIDEGVLERLKCVHEDATPPYWAKIEDLVNCTQESFDDGRCPQGLS